MSKDTVFKLISTLPDSVKCDIVDIQDVKMRDGYTAIRITLDRLLTATEKEVMSIDMDIVGLDCTGHHQYAPELRKSYFYVYHVPYRRRKNFRVKRKGETE